MHTLDGGLRSKFCAVPRMYSPKKLGKGASVHIRFKQRKFPRGMQIKGALFCPWADVNAHLVRVTRAVSCAFQFMRSPQTFTTYYVAYMCVHTCTRTTTDMQMDKFKVKIRGKAKRAAGGEAEASLLTRRWYPPEKGCSVIMV